MEYFKFTEMIKSDVATKNKIDNYPKRANIISNLYNLIKFLNPMRKEWGSPVLITSGYRCNELNAILGGSDKSAHKIGFAVDMIPKNGYIIDFFHFMKRYLLTNELDFDELILENKGNSVWIHFALYSIDGKQRKKILQLDL